jgi:chromate reductase
MKKVVAISGSTRRQSTNHALIKAISSIAMDDLNITLFDSLAGIPAFNPDIPDNETPDEVMAFRKLIQNADGVIICTPEYAHGVPGSLKNAIDWTVGTSEFSQKSTLLITASTDGRYGHRALLETLKVIEAKNIEEQNLLIQFAQTKINSDGTIKDANTLEEIKRVVDMFVRNLV